MDSPANNIRSYDVVVIGGGPAGCEAAAAAGRAGARTLCLTINLDTVGFPPATPVLVEDKDDVRGAMLEEMVILGGILPAILSRQEVTETDRGQEGYRRRTVVDRRNLGLACKEILESAAGVELRQALVASLEPVAGTAGESGFRITTNLGEKFIAASVVVAAGTFLKGVVDDAGDLVRGGRRGEIPANALALWLQNLGFRLVEVSAASPPRLDSRSLISATAADGGSLDESAGPIAPGMGAEPVATGFPGDGSQLGELLGLGLRTGGNRLAQLKEARGHTGAPGAWITRAACTVRHQALAANQVGRDLESPQHPGLFFAGRAAGSCNYIEAAALGLVSGTNAAARALGTADPCLTEGYKFVNKLCEAISSQKDRPVTIRLAGPGRQ